jgi:very-short-patch-repair endonuclease
VTRVVGVQSLLGIDPVDDDPLVLGVRLDVTSSSRAVVVQCDDALQAVAVGLFPTWMPGADAVDGTATLDHAAAEALADRLGRSSPDYAPYLRELTSAALGSRRVDGGVALEQRLRGAVRVLARAYARTPVLVLVGVDGGTDAHRDAVFGDAAAWIADRGQVAVWIDASEVGGLDRFPLVDLSSPPHDPPAPAAVAERVTIPPVAGFPAPNSPAEQALERHLSHQDWTVGRRWNTLVATASTLDPPIRVDLVWPEAMVIVEIDGADHRTAAKYAADRIRDNLLQRQGFLVLRYTNEQVLHDVAAVAAELHRVLAARGTLVQFRREADPGAERMIQQ